MSLTYHKYPTHNEQTIQAAKAVLAASGYTIKYRNRDGKQYMTLMDYENRTWELGRSIVEANLKNVGISLVMLTSGSRHEFTMRINPEESGFVWTDDNTKLPAPRPVIDSFKGKHKFLSNFHSSPIYGYPSVEHAYQASKCANDADKKQFRTGTPDHAKRSGRKVQLRADWSDQLKIEIMRVLVREKFRAHPKLAQRLVATNTDELIEGNWWGDTFWGVCDGEGENHLGKILMDIRTDLSREDYL